MKIQGMLAAVATPFDHTGAIYRAKVQHNFEKWSPHVAGRIRRRFAGRRRPAARCRREARTAAPGRAARSGRAAPSSRMSARKALHRAAKLARAAAEAGAHAVVSSRAASIPQHDVRAGNAGALLPRAGGPVARPVADPQRAADHRRRSVRRNRWPGWPSIRTSPASSKPARRSRASRRFVPLAPKDFGVLAGTESQVWESLKAGANGAALAFASAAPYATIAIWEAFRTREEEAGVDWQGRISHPSILVTDMYGVARPEACDGSERILRRSAAPALRAGVARRTPRNRRSLPRLERLVAVHQLTVLSVE